MKTKETLIRFQALDWWKTQSQGRQNYLTNTYIGGQRFSHSLTGREIVDIWRKEMKLKNAEFNNTTFDDATEPVKYSWSREEVVSLINKFEFDTFPDRYEGYGTEQEDIDKWIEENL